MAERDERGTQREREREIEVEAARGFDVIRSRFPEFEGNRG